MQRALDAGSNIKELSYVAAILKILSFGVSEDTSVIFEVAKRDGLRPTQRMYGRSFRWRVDIIVLARQ